jgi:hypothetical protein
MDIFLSWSGEKSKKAAESFSKWLPNVIQVVSPYFTPSDIHMGERWGAEIAKKLENCQFGIIFLTKENLEAPWVLFEAGALSKNLGKARVCSILLDKTLTTGQLSNNPLSQFQISKFNKSDIKDLLSSINSSLEGKALSESRLNDAFERCWPEIEKEIKVVIDNTHFGVHSILPNFPNEKFISLLENSKHKIRLLNTWVPRLEDYESPIKEVLKKGVDVEMLLLHPKSPIVELREKTLNHNKIAEVVSVKNGLNSNRKIIKNIAEYKQDKNLNGNLSLRLYNTVPAISIFQVDDTMYVSIFVHGKLAVDSPQMKIIDDQSNMRKFIEDEFNEIWNNDVICRPVDNLINITSDDYLDKIANNFGL